MNRIPLFASPLLILVTAIAQGQTPAYLWDDNEGGLVDQVTGLVWGFGPTNVGGGTGNYDYALNSAGAEYVALGWGYGHTDWRLPTKAEFQDATTKDVYGALNFHADRLGLFNNSFTELYRRSYWVSDAPFREKSLWKAYVGELDTGLIRTTAVTSIVRMIVVRQASPYAWDDTEGGLVDRGTGLVWGFGPTNIGGPLYTYQEALDYAADDYAAGPGGAGFTDWRVPSKQELTDAAAKGLYADLASQAAQLGLPMPEAQYWTADPPFKSKGSWLAYIVNLDTGKSTTANIDTAVPAIVVRQASGN